MAQVQNYGTVQNYVHLGREVSINQLESVRLFWNHFPASRAAPGPRPRLSFFSTIPPIAFILAGHGVEDRRRCWQRFQKGVSNGGLKSRVWHPVAADYILES
jgi:hypothetical protein